jgi:hypothetical protein
MVRSKEKRMNSVGTDEKKPSTGSKTVALKLVCDARPLELFLKLLQFFIESGKAVVDSAVELPKEAVRIESDVYATGTGELRVTLYPSDALLQFMSALITSDKN